MFIFNQKKTRISPLGETHTKEDEICFTSWERAYRYWHDFVQSTHESAEKAFSFYSVEMQAVQVEVGAIFMAFGTAREDGAEVAFECCIA